MEVSNKVPLFYFNKKISLILLTLKNVIVIIYSIMKLYFINTIRKLSINILLIIAYLGVAI